MARDYKWSFSKKEITDLNNSGEQATLDLFRDLPITRSTIREYAQNSIDAHSKKEGAPMVYVDFSLVKLDDNTKEILFRSLKEHASACNDMSNRSRSPKNPFKPILDYINDNEHKDVFCLKISDYNTTGMMFRDESHIQTREEFLKLKRAPFNVCVRDNGASDKDDKNAGGSHGRGKNVGFLLSQMDAVYYMTMTEETKDDNGNIIPSKKFGEGIVQYCDHIIFPEDGSAPQGYGFLGFFDSHEGKRPDEDDEIPAFFKRDMPGTDAYILGVELTNDDNRELKKYLLRSFFPAIAMEQVNFKIFGEPFNKDNLIDKINEYFREDQYTNYDNVHNNYRREFNPRPYCLEAFLKPEDDNHIIKRVNSTDFPHLGEGELHLWVDETIKSKSKDCILCMRDKGMVIEVRRLRFGKGFYGVFICGGDGSESLRLMENVTHDVWEKRQLDRAKKEDKEKALEAYKEIDLFIEKCVNEVFPRIEGAENNVPGLDKIMSSAGIKSQTNGVNNSSGTSDFEDYDLLSLSIVAEDLIEKQYDSNKAGELSIRENGGINKKVKKRFEGQKTKKEKKKEDKDNDDQKKDHKTDNENKEKKTSGSHDESGTERREGEFDPERKGKHNIVIPALFMQKSIHVDNQVVHRIRIQSPNKYPYCSMVVNAADMSSNNGSPLSIRNVKRVMPSQIELETEGLSDSIKIEGIGNNTVRGFCLVEGYNTFDVVFNDNSDHSLIITAYENK